MTPEATSPATTSVNRSALPRYSGGPSSASATTTASGSCRSRCRRRRGTASCRSWPAAAGGTGRARSMTPMAVSRSGTPTWTWQPQMSCWLARPAHRSIIASYRGAEVIACCCQPPKGCVDAGRTATPASAAAAAASRPGRDELRPELLEGRADAGDRLDLGRGDLGVDPRPDLLAQRRGGELRAGPQLQGDRVDEVVLLLDAEGRAGPSGAWLRQRGTEYRTRLLERRHTRSIARREAPLAVPLLPRRGGRLV